MTGSFVGVLKGNGSEGGGEFTEAVFGGLVDFVAESAVAVHYFDVEVDVAAWGLRMLASKCLEGEGAGLTSSGVGY